MHKIYYFLFVLFFIPCHNNAQGEFDNWYFGNKAGVTFNSGSPICFLTSALDVFTGGSSNISDSLGNILFYTNGNFIYNRNNSILDITYMRSCCSDYDRHNIAFQWVDEPTKYYLFAGGCSSPPTAGLQYAVIDMTLNGGLGGVPAGMKDVYLQGAERAYTTVTATRHHNNRDVWVVTRLQDTDSNFYASYLINATGINLTPILSNSHLQLYTPPAASQVLQNIKISRDGTKIAAVYTSFVEFCNFNSNNGQITPLFLVTLPICGTRPITPDDAEFSIDSKYLYVAGSGGSSTCPDPHGYLFQFDATITDSALFKNSVVQISIEEYAPGLQLAPDKKIYCTMLNIDSLSVINNPSSPGTGCNYQRDVLSLDGRQSQYLLPDYVERYYAIIYDTGQCQEHTIHFASAIWPPADSIHWDFGDPASGYSDFSNLPNPFHIYSNPGAYTVELFVKHIDNRTDTAWQVVNILASPQPNLGPDQTICIGDSVTFNAGACNGCTYQWKNLGTGLVVSTGQTYKTGSAGTYSVTVTKSNNCSGSDTVQLFTSAVPSVTNNPLSESICSGNSTNISLTSSVPGTLFHWTASLTSGNITGFSADSGLVINQILTDNLTTPGIVTYSITPKVGSCSGSTVDYQVTVTPGAPVSVGITASQNNVCAGTSITYTAVPTNGGANPAYQWKVNGANSGTNSNTFTYTPVNNDIITCVLTSSITTCISNNPATSNAITMTVNPLQPVSVNVAPSQNPVCAGASVTFTATPTNGGISPTYQWKVNGAGVGTNSSTYTYTPVNGDIVTCVLTSNAVCPTGNPATSNTVTMTVNPSFTLSLTIAASANPFCLGSLITFTATPTNGGTSPAYQWKVNGVNAGTNSSTYSYHANDGDSVRCVMTSNLNCVTGNPASSLDIIMSGTLASQVTFISCFDTITTVNAKPIKLKGGIPLGGTYSGPGVNSLTGIFTPSAAGTGTKTITYTYTNVSSCSASKTIHIIVQATPVFTCGNTLTDIRDNKTYATVQIGSQCWMASNLNYGTILVSTQDQRDNCLFEKYCYNDNPANCTSLGALYQWDELMQYDNTPADQGFCPPGWHIPSENDWNTLFANYINNGFAGNPLKYSGYSGFNALLSGENYFNKSWNYSGFATFFWSSTSHSPTQAWAHGMNEEDPSVSVYPASRANAFSVRCIKD